MSPAQLGACGCSAKAVRRRINEGTWHRVGGAIVLAPGHSGAAGWNDVSLSWILRVTFGPQTRISGALALRRARWHLPHETHVVVLKDKPNFGLSGVNVLRRPDIDADDTAAELRFVTAREALAARVGRGRLHATGLRQLIARATSGSRSEAEQRMSRLLRRSGTGPRAIGILRGAITEATTTCPDTTAGPCKTPPPYTG